jgi:hypothetical protein
MATNDESFEHKTAVSLSVIALLALVWGITRLVGAIVFDNTTHNYDPVANQLAYLVQILKAIGLIGVAGASALIALIFKR